MERKVVDYTANAGTTLRELIEKFGRSGGFTSTKVYIAYKILEEMVNDGECTRFISFPACIVATGLRGILAEVIRRRLFDVVITTCGALDHDFARVWADYYHGDFYANDAELHARGIHRLGNVFIPKESYGPLLEEKLQDLFSRVIGDEEISPSELIKKVALEINSPSSIFYVAAKNNVEVFVPGIMDGAFGSQLWLYAQKRRVRLNIIEDQNKLADIVFNAKKTGALIIGGGISKHHTIWWNQFRGGLDYAVYITTAQEYDGSLSGARLREAISWGKVSVKARYVTVEGDATVLLPLIIGPVLR
ncbi:MAG: deoxyhypusine synthase [Thermoplasmata archaeon]|nr:MAG: deoxyhypusine synthase [Thermoplasmata archaeon]